MARKMSLVSLLLLFLAGIKIGGILWLRTRFVSRTYTFVGDDYPRIWPIKLPEKQVLIPIHDTIRYQLETEDGAAEWSASMAENGMIYLGKQCRPFSISMFHQIRCLDTLGKAFVGVKSRNGSSTRPDTEDWDLIRHCMNYLRQMMFCHSRTYLDPLLGYPQPNGYPDTDQCPDWSVVYDEVQRNRQRCGK
ncbi:hypothetical protein DFH08DRAFT_88964 [Mycena albidolilacea]|uniref:Uncharacterized protein n=1 Tax=Mycena albidolilacea TaxID=1033008 RepID=A0AAD7A998_9AGAR|nr:hypothetical protein DFH08DRAFT_88964 [Mycena albidolilacea]